MANGLNNPHVKFENYKDRYKNIRLERKDGILLVTLHTRGGPFLFSDVFHTDSCDAFANIAADFENKCVIVTGTGDNFAPGWSSTLTSPTPMCWPASNGKEERCCST